jgi:hypothetical protein
MKLALHRFLIARNSLCALLRKLSSRDPASKSSFFQTPLHPCRTTSFSRALSLATKHSSLATSSVLNPIQPVSFKNLPSNPHRINLFNKSGARPNRFRHCSRATVVVGAGLQTGPLQREASNHPPLTRIYSRLERTNPCPANSNPTRNANSAPS